MPPYQTDQISTASTQTTWKKASPDMTKEGIHTTTAVFLPKIFILNTIRRTQSDKH